MPDATTHHGPPAIRPALSVVPVGGPPGPDLALAIAELGPAQLVVGSGGSGGATAPSVTVVDHPASVSAGFLQAALDAATGELVLFVDAAAKPSAGWLEPALAQFDHDDALSCLALLPARPISVFGWPQDGAPPLAAGTDALYAPIGGLLARRDHLRVAGGFDPVMDGAGVDIDLGWRVWLSGGWIRSLGSPLGLPAPPAPVLDARQLTSGLARCYLLYGDELRAATLPAALVAAHTAAGAPEAGAAIEAFRHLLPALRQRREELQARRRRHDKDLSFLFSRPLDLSPDLATLAGPVVEGFDLEAAFGSRRRILVVTADVFTAQMAGPAIRAWQIAEALSCSHDVILATLSPTCELHSDRFGVEAADQLRIAELEAWCDVVILQGFVLHSAPPLRATEKVMVVDIYDPLHFETLELSKRDDQGNRTHHLRTAVDTLNEQLTRGDFFICASEKQRDLWIGHLSALGRINPTSYDHDPTLRRLIDVVPFGLPDEDARRERPAIKGVVPGISAEDEVVLWGGGIYNWFDPLTLIRAVDRLRLRRPRVRLFFLGVRHPNPGVNPMLKTAAAAQGLSDQLGLTNVHVFFNESWVAYEDRQNYLLDADVGVSTHLDHAETAYSFRTRMLDYLWAGLPIVATEGDGFADLITREGLGVSVPAGDVDALEAALYRILDDVEYASLCRKNVEALRPAFAWSEALRPLLAFCDRARRAPDLIGVSADEVAGPVAAAQRYLAHDARIIAALYREGGVRRVVAGARTRAVRAMRGGPA